VLAPTKEGKPVRFKVTRDGAVLGDDHGADSAPDGTGEVRDPRLYQLIWLERQVQDRTLRSNSLIPAFRVFVHVWLGDTSPSTPFVKAATLTGGRDSEGLRGASPMIPYNSTVLCRLHVCTATGIRN
jgi:Thioredoxin like C-terminal domain